MLMHIHKKYTKQHILKKQVAVILSCIHIYVLYYENVQKFKQLDARTQQKIYYLFLVIFF